MTRLLTAHIHDPETGEVEAEPVTTEQIGNALRMTFDDGLVVDFDRAELREELLPLLTRLFAKGEAA